MSVIQKTEAIVLSVMKYSDSSKIAHLFTKAHGKLSVIVKGGRTRQSSTGRAVDPLNHIEAVIYNRESRDLQTLSSADLLTYFPMIRENLDILKHALAVLELVQNLTVEHEQHVRLFDGLARILRRFEENTEPPRITMLRFIVFLFGELGFEISTNGCSQCGEKFDRFPIVFSYQRGFVCHTCGFSVVPGIEVLPELFSFFLCLKIGKPVVFSASRAEEWLEILEKFAEFHLPQYRKLNALRL